MKRREFLSSTIAAGAGLAFAENLFGEGDAQTPAGEKLIGMYIHQHWPYRHPYAARTWTFEDWHGYLDGLHRLGYNMVMIWPMIEILPHPLTASDAAHLEKLRRVIDAAHQDFGMKVWLALCPNIVPIDEYASRVAFENRHFFYSDVRVNPADPKAMDDMMARREELLRPLAQADAMSIIDSDPGGYANSNNKEFVDLLVRHRRLFDKLRPGIELIYWVHVGWPAYGRWYATGNFSFGTPEEYTEAFTLLMQSNPEPWGLATIGHSDLPRKNGLESKVMSLNYGGIEGEPSFPMTNFGGDTAYKCGNSLGPRGAMGNAQTHCIQLPNTFAFIRGAKGLPLEEKDYLQFANDLLPGRGETILTGWNVLAGSNSGPMREAVKQLKPLAKEKLEAGPLKGFLFGNPNRFVNDLCQMLELRAAFCDFAEAVSKNQPVVAPFAEFIRAADQWQTTHGYENSWVWGGLNESLVKLNVPELTQFLAENDAFQTGKFPGNTPFDKVKTAMSETETYTPRLLQAMKRALRELEAR